MQFKVKAGKFIFDKQTKKVKVSKDKGLIRIHINEEEQIHFKWINLDTNIEQVDVIVFPGDAVFQPVVDCKNTYVLRFGMDDERYFYWIQEKIDSDVVVKEINKIINTTLQHQQQQIIPQVSQPEKAPQIQKKQQKMQTKLQPNFNQQPHPDFGRLSKLIHDISALKKRQNTTVITHLNEIFTTDALNTIMNDFTQTDFQQLLQYLPEQHQNIKLFPSTLRSPQFQQALDALSDALNSENVIPLFIQMGLNQQFLNSNFGVEAFLLALIQKSSKKI